MMGCYCSVEQYIILDILKMSLVLVIWGKWGLGHFVLRKGLVTAETVAMSGERRRHYPEQL